MKIVYKDKESINIDETVEVANKITASDINEIKNVVNANDDILIEAIDNITELQNLDLGDTMPIGSVVQWFGDIAPINWLVLDGRAISRVDYAELFEIYGTKYGEGDGSTTFNLPDLRDYVPVGKSSTDININEIGKKYGEKTHKLTIREMPKHYHSVDNYNPGGYDLDHLPAINAEERKGWYGQGAIRTNNNGEDYPHNNMQPSIAVNFIVKVKKNVEPAGIVVDNFDSDSSVDASSARLAKVLNDRIGHVLFENIDGALSGNFSESIEGYKHLKWYILSADNRQGYCETVVDLRNSKFDFTWLGGTDQSSGYSYLYSMTVEVTSSGFNCYRSSELTRANSNWSSASVQNKIIKVIGTK